MNTNGVVDESCFTRRKFIRTVGLYTITLTLPNLFWSCSSPASIRTPSTEPSSQAQALIELPEPRLENKVSLEETLLRRRSLRIYDKSPLISEQISQLLWAAQGVTAEWGGRTAPSAGALYPLEIYLAVGNVTDIPVGVFRYIPQSHDLVIVKDSDVRKQLAEAALSQRWVEEAAVDIVIAAIYERTTKKYGDRGVRYVHLEAGHAAQNICLQAATLDLGIVTVGAFHDSQVADIMGMTEDEIPVYIMPVGRKRVY
ncbi:MAG: SagB/ThcOx family dehydrogenase [Dehalococcoidales bacterium]|nr:MAG: SagB/ThcOx family dehydrogenase [Dehalococcoidales bacterium]